MLVDSHCHLDFPDFAPELDAVVARAEAAGVGRMVTISTRVRRHAQVLAIAERFPNVTCSVGTHPHHAHEELDITADDLIARAQHPKVVAIGEAGLDYHYDNSPRDAQEQGFRTHIAAARATQLPLVIHAREADDDTARILEEEMGKGPFPAVLHCYTGGPDLARRAIALGHSISFTGIVTFKNSGALREIAKSLPADRFLVETDAPYLAPLPYRGKRNEPAYVTEVAKVLAEVRGVSAGRDRAPDHGELLPPVRQSFARHRCRCMTLTFTILGCASSGGVPRPGTGWGACDPANPKNRRRRCALLVERKGAGRRHARAGRYRAGPARPADRRQRRLARCRALQPRARRPHPRHRRSARAVPESAPPSRRLRRRRDLAHADDALRLLLRAAGRQRVSADPQHARAQGRRAVND